MAREIETDVRVVKELAEGEKIVWQGAPEAFPTVTEDNKKSLTGRWLGCIIAAVVLIVVYLVGFLGSGNTTVVWFFAILLLIVAYIAYMPLMDKNNIYKKCKYYISDRRVILHYGENDIHTMPLTGLNVAFIPAEEGCVIVELGSTVGIKNGKHRACAFVPKKDDNDNVCGFVLYNVADSKELRAALGK